MAWLVAVLLFTLFPLESDNPFMFLAEILTLGKTSIYPLILGLFGGIALLFWAGRRRMGIAIPVAALLIGLPVYDLIPSELPLRIRVSYFIRQGELESIRKKVLADPSRDWKSPVEVDRGNPVRVGYGMGGIIDNWYGFVWDPTDKLANEDSGSYLRNGTRTEMTRLFGGDLVSAARVSGHWYWCTFT
jgi:hypothetical protein